MPPITDSVSKLLDAAEKVLISNDGHMEMNQVAKHAGASVGLAYHHFGSKAGLVAAVIDRFYEPLRVVALGDAIPLELAWPEREYARTKALIDYFYDHPLAPLVAGRLARTPELLDIERAHMDALLEAGARNISQGQKQGVLSLALSPQTTVAMLMGGLRLVIDRAILAPYRPPRDELLDQLWVLSCGALRIDPSLAYSPENRDD